MTLKNLNFNQGFSYAEFDNEVQSFVKQRTYVIKALMHRTAQDIIEIGLKLIEVKNVLGHGKFNEWLRTEIDCGEWTARKFMEVSRKFKSVDFSDLEIAPSALYLLASKKAPDLAVDEILKRARQKERITHAIAKEVLARHANINHNRIKTDIGNANLTTSNKGVNSSVIFANEESSVGKNIAPASLNSELNFNTESSKIYYKFEDYMPSISSDQQYFQYSESSTKSLDVVSKMDLDTEQVSNSSFMLGESVSVIQLDQKSLQWGGKVAKVEGHNGKPIKLVIEIDEITYSENIDIND
ncbi:MAG: DUF3102 domain-containing protein [Cyanobacteria bacterium P01_H01_bin.21]